MIWYEDEKISIRFDKQPEPQIRKIFPDMEDYEVEDIERLPFINKRRLIVNIYNYVNEEPYVFVIKKDFKWDGATIPRLVWSILGISRTDNIMLIPSMIHDRICSKHEVVNYRREVSNWVLDGLLKANKMNIIQRKLIMFFVSLWQRIIWHKK